MVRKSKISGTNIFIAKSIAIQTGHDWLPVTLDSRPYLEEGLEGLNPPPSRNVCTTRTDVIKMYKSTFLYVF